jgi:hypothetical protein
MLDPITKFYKKLRKNLTIDVFPVATWYPKPLCLIEKAERVYTAE